MGYMEEKMMKFESRTGNGLALRAVPGHFATSHSHINYYVDMTMLKTRHSDAVEVAKSFVSRIDPSMVIDTIVCMDGSEVIGAYIAAELQKGSYMNRNEHNSVYVVTPEFNFNNQMLFRDNLVPEIKGKNVLLLLATSTTGLTIERSLQCIDYYGGHVRKVCSVFSMVETCGGYEIDSIFTGRDIPGYQAFEPHYCPFCKQRTPLDAMVNGYGYSKL